jgi:hypothetical protein
MVPVDIVGRELVAALAMRLGCVDEPHLIGATSPPVLGGSYRLQMVRVDASPGAAEMIELHALGNRAD